MKNRIIKFTLQTASPFNQHTAKPTTTTHKTYQNRIGNGVERMSEGNFLSVVLKWDDELRI